MRRTLVETDERELGDTKYQLAARKAWKTIRSNKAKSFAEGSLLLNEFAVRENAPTKNSYTARLISTFDKTPADICCGKFVELRWGFGCPLDCNYCYLRGTRKGDMRPRFIDFKYIDRALDEAFSTLETPSIFNTGELSDSLMNPALMEKIVDKFEEQNKHRVFLLSKFGPKNVEFLVRKPRKQAICAWSINAIEVARRWERAAAHPERRIEAAKLVYRAGYDTRVRIDPMFPVDAWKTHYEDILYRIFDAFEPKRIILGTPRGLWKTIEYAKRAGVDMSWSDYFAPEETGWGKKLVESSRLEMYQYMMDKLQGIGYPRRRVTLCKETVSLWEKLCLKPKRFNCNCYGPDAMMD